MMLNETLLQLMESNEEKTLDLFVVVTTVGLLAVLFVLGIGANSLLLLAFHRRPALRTTSNRFVGNLLVVNLLSTLLLIPLICIDITPASWWRWPAPAPVRCIFSEFISSWVSSASMLGTLLIGLDQYLAILFPLRYIGIVAGSRTWIMLAFSWAICLIVAGVSSMSEESSIWYVCLRTSKVQLDFGDKYSLILPSLNYVVLFILPILLIGLIYSRIYLEAAANSERVRRGSNSTLTNGPNPVEGMYKCSVKILHARNDSIASSMVDAGMEEQPLKRSSGSFSEKLARNELVRATSTASTQLMTSIRHKISNANLFIQKHKEELHSAKISMVIFVMVLACWLPFHTSVLLLRVHLLLCQNWPGWARCITHLLVVIYPTLSPYVFAFRCTKLQKELKRMIKGRNSNSWQVPTKSQSELDSLKTGLVGLHLKKALKANKAEEMMVGKKKASFLIGDQDSCKETMLKNEGKEETLAQAQPESGESSQRSSISSQKTNSSEDSCCISDLIKGSTIEMHL